MYRNSAAKRTGIYRVSGNMSDFQMEIKLRHISEWLPVPKFEYTGANANAKHGDHYPESPLSSTWGDFFIYVPHEDQHGNYYNYYNYYNPGSEYPSSAKASGSRSYGSSSGAATGGTRDPSGATTGSSLQTRSYELSSHLEQSNDGFYAQNKELCNGGTANLCIGWQQKHFSRAELQRFGDGKQCVTTLQRRYHRWTQDIIELQQRHQREVDRHQADYEEELRVRRRKAKRKGGTPLSSLAISEYSLEAPPLPEDPNFAARTCLIHTLIDADLEEVADPALQEEAQKLRDMGYQLMYVYAQLQRDTLLLSLRYSPAQGLLYVYPDFNFSADDMDYVLEIDNDCRQLYAYGFQNVTPLRSCLLKEPLYHKLSEQLQQEPLSDRSLPPSDASAEQLLAHYQKQRVQAAERRRLLQFSLPPKRMRRVSLLLELRQAQHFENNNIHVRYYVNPPTNTLLEPANPDDPFPLRGATATCLAGGGKRLACFSHCWQLTLLCEETYQPDQLLHVYFEVISIDSWQRERCEGYAHFSCSLLSPLPSTVVDGIQLQCMRPVGSWLDALNRYFIGGRTLFDFVGYFNGNSRANSLHSRLELNKACAMRSTGTLLFSMRKLQQRKLQLGHHLEMYDSDDESSPKSGKVARTTLDEVLAAYVEARDRIESLLGHAAAL